MASSRHDARRGIPSVERLLRAPRARDLLRRYSRSFVLEVVRQVLDDVRRAGAPSSDPGQPAGATPAARTGERPGSAAATTLDCEEGPQASAIGLEERILARVEARLERGARSRLRPVINGTGVVLHTNLGRALLAAEAARVVAEAAANPVTLELDLATGGRGERDRLVEEDLAALTGAEAATVVNNNAAAVLLALNTLAEGREVIVSRGELIEIGGSFRLPEIMAKSGAALREVGTTNRTHIDDYRRAIGPETALLLKVHTSNYRIVGFTADVPLDALVDLGRTAHLPVLVDLGSGALVDLAAYGLPREPLVADVVGPGADVVTFSGDKLLGGSQAGILAGKRAVIERIRANPVRRAVRPGKLDLAALEATLRLYRQSADLARELPTLRWLTRSIEEMETVGRAAAGLLAERLGPGYAVEVVACESEVGSGALPGVKLPSRALAIRHPDRSAADIARRFRQAEPPVIGRVSGGTFLLDLRGIFAPEELGVVFGS
jgi:L-seryl-tRNA(Ser) seleniumtransferase